MQGLRHLRVIDMRNLGPRNGLTRPVDHAHVRVIASQRHWLYPGVHAVWWYRLANKLWRMDFKLLGRVLSHMARMLSGIEIHPGATIGRSFASQLRGRCSASKSTPRTSRATRLGAASSRPASAPRTPNPTR